LKIEDKLTAFPFFMENRKRYLRFECQTIDDYENGEKKNIYNKLRGGEIVDH
jgi:hypothetical protein